MNKNYFSLVLQTVILASCCQLPTNAQINPQIENSPVERVQIENPRVKYVDRTTAQQKATEIFLTQGKITSLLFENNTSKNGASIEKISTIALSDSSKDTYFISQDNNTGQQGKIVFIRQIKPIEFPNATTTEVPNLVVVTVDRQGNESEFVFNINNDNPEKFTEKVVITEPIEQLQITINTAYGEASPEDIKLGLDTLIKSGKIAKNDNLIFQINEYYALTTNGTSSKAAQEKLDLPLSILQKLAEIGQEEDTKRRLTAK